MTEVAQHVSPKKIPIDDWINAVKKVEPTGLKAEEKKLFEQVKAHKNIPKTSSKFSNFCIHNLKIKDEKVINRIWGQLSGALNEQKAKIAPKETKEIKKSKLDKKFDVKKDAKPTAAVTNGKAKVDGTPKVDVTPKVDGKPDKKKEKESPKDVKKAKAQKNADLKKERAASNGKDEEQPTKKAKIIQKDVKEAKKAMIEKKLKPAVKEQQKPQQKQKQQEQPKQKQNQQEQQKQQKALANGKVKKQQGNVSIDSTGKKQEVKKKVSFGKNDTSDKKGDSLSKMHKQTPAKKPAAAMNVKGKKKPEIVQEDEDDDDEDDDDEDIDEDLDSDEDISIEDSDLDLDDSDGEELSFDDEDMSDDLDDDDDDDDDDDLMDSDDDDDDDDE